MGKKLVLFSTILLAVGAAFTLLNHHEAEAKVCFVNDPNCGDGSISSTIPGVTSCINAGYTCTGSLDNCNSSVSLTNTDGCANGNDLSGCWRKVNCPINGNYFMKCPKAYKLSCQSPYVSSASCGSLKACNCPTSFKYTLHLTTNSNPDNITTVPEAAVSTNVLHCTASGPACAPIDGAGSYETDPWKMVYPICVCSGEYLYSMDQKPGNSQPYKENDEYCINSNGEEYYKGWNCDPIYNKRPENCPFGVDDTAGKCFNYSDHTWYYKSCKDCSMYPSEDLKYVKTDVSVPGTPYIEGCANNDTIASINCMKNNFKAKPTHDGWDLQDETITEDNVSYGPYKKYFVNAQGENWYSGSGANSYRYWDEDKAKYTYITCPYSNSTQGDRYYIVECSEPGMRPSTSQDIKEDEDGNPMLDAENNPIYYKNGEACIPVSCEDAVKQVLKIGMRLDSSNVARKLIDKYGLLLSKENRILGEDVGVGSSGDGQIEDYYFVDGNGNPIVEQYVNGRGGGYLRKVVQSNTNVTSIRAGTPPGYTIGFYGYGYKSNDEPAYFDEYIAFNASVNQAGINAYTAQNSARRFAGRRKAIVIGTVELDMMGGVYNQPKLVCNRRPCYAEVNGVRKYWGSEDGSGGNPSLCNKPEKTCGAGKACSVQGQGGWSNSDKKMCTLHYDDDASVPYWNKSANPILGNNSSNGGTKCGDVANGENCVTCFARGYVVQSIYTSAYGASESNGYTQYDCTFFDDRCNLRPRRATPPGQSQINFNNCVGMNETSVANKPTPSQDNNCLDDDSTGPGSSNGTLTYSATGTLYGRYSQGAGLGYVNGDLKLQNWSATDPNSDDPNCVSTNDSHENFRGFLGLGSAPVDEYVSVEAFYDDITNGDTYQQVFRRMLERSCHVHTDRFQRPLIKYTGEQFPAKDNEYYKGKMTGNNVVNMKDTEEFDAPVMSFKGIDISLESPSTTIVRAFEFDNVKLNATNGSGYLKLSARDQADLSSSTITNSSTIVAKVLVNEDQLFVTGSTIDVAGKFEHNSNLAEIEDTNITVCNFTNNSTMHLTSTDGSHMFGDRGLISGEESKKCPNNSRLQTIKNEFISNRYKYVARNFDIDGSTAFNQCTTVIFTGSGNNDIAVTPIVNGNTTTQGVMDLRGTILFSNMKISTHRLIVGINDQEANYSLQAGNSTSSTGADCPRTGISNGESTTQFRTFDATIVNMNQGSKISIPSNGQFTIEAPAVIGKVPYNDDACANNGVEIANGGFNCLITAKVSLPTCIDHEGENTGNPIRRGCPVISNWKYLSPSGQCMGVSNGWSSALIMTGGSGDGNGNGIGNKGSLAPVNPSFAEDPLCEYNYPENNVFFLSTFVPHKNAYLHGRRLRYITSNFSTWHAYIPDTQTSNTSSEICYLNGVWPNEAYTTNYDVMGTGVTLCDTSGCAEITDEKMFGSNYNRKCGLCEESQTNCEDGL